MKSARLFVSALKNAVRRDILKAQQNSRKINRNLKKDYTIVIVTHNMQQAMRISDKTAFFLLGDLIEYSDTETLFSTPKEKKTEDYITGRFG